MQVRFTAETNRAMDGEIAFYDNLYSDYPLKWDAPWRDAAAYVALSKYIQNPEKFIDIGCGNGHTIRYFMSFWDDTKYYGLDYSNEAIRVARYRVPDATFICEPFIGSSAPKCDVSTVMGVAEHFHDLPEFFEKLHDCADLVYLESPNCLEYSDSEDEGFRQTHEGNDQVEWHLRRETWEDHITNAGWEILESIKGDMVTTEFIWVLK